MRKQLAIGLSLLLLTALGGEWHNFSHESQSSASQKIHNSEISFQSIDLHLPTRNSFQTASVSFITGGDALSFPEFPDNSPEQCKNFGFTLTSCPSGNPSGICPYNTSYFKECCDARYKYNKNECTYPNTVSGDSCGGKFMCYCDRSLYPETKCVSPQIPEGDTCVEEGVTYYSKCVCPTYYSQTCDGQNQQGVGEGCTQDGVTKYTSCECKAGYTMTCSDMGPSTPTDYCLKDGIKYYNSCKTCENKCTLDSCPEGILCEYEDCSQKYCDIGCATNYIEWCTQPETDCATLGYTTPADVCDDIEAIKCPYDTAAVFCKGAIKCQAGAVLASDKKCYDATNLPSSVKAIAVVFDPTNQLAVALTDVKKDGSAGSVEMTWSSSYCDTPNLENCTDESTALTTCGTNGRANTDAILASTCNGTTYAANAVNAYQTSNCRADFCQKGKWFLPSQRDLNTIYSNKSVINNSLTLLVSMGASNLQESWYWSSTEYSSNTAWGLGVHNGYKLNYGKKSDSSYVRPVIYYGEEKEPTPATCKVGDILYSDKTFSADIIAGKKAIGVVFDADNRLAVALDQTSLYWSTERVDIPTLGNCNEAFSCSTNGKQNTAAIMEYVKTNGKTGKYPAAEYCASYKPSTVYQDEAWYAEGQWFLPSMKELQTLYNHKAVVNASLQKVNAVTLTENGYWSSTEYSSNPAWGVRMNGGNTYYGSKYLSSYDVRPVLAF